MSLLNAYLYFVGGLFVIAGFSHFIASRSRMIAKRRSVSESPPSSTTPGPSSPLAACCVTCDVDGVRMEKKGW